MIVWPGSNGCAEGRLDVGRMAKGNGILSGRMCDMGLVDMGLGGVMPGWGGNNRNFQEAVVHAPPFLFEEAAPTDVWRWKEGVAAWYRGVGRMFGRVRWSGSFGGGC